VQKLSVAVHKAEADASTVEDKEAATRIRLYYEMVTDRKKVCEGTGAMALYFDKASAHSALGLK